MQKGTMLGVSTDLSVLLTNPPLGEPKSIMHRLLGRLDLFVFWQMILWVIGLTVVYKSTIQKALMPVLTLWIVWVIIAVSLGAVLGKFIPGSRRRKKKAMSFQKTRVVTGRESKVYSIAKKGDVDPDIKNWIDDTQWIHYHSNQDIWRRQETDGFGDSPQHVAASSGRV